MRKKISITIDDEETIKKLVDSVNDVGAMASNYGQSINAIRNIVIEGLESKQEAEKINPFTTEDYWQRINHARKIILMLMGLAVKKYIPKERYKDITLKAFPGNLEKVNGSETYGINYKNDENKILNGIYLCAIEYLATGKIVEFSRSIGVFAHEMYHTKQKFSLEKAEFSISNLINALERIAYDKDEYDENYNHIFFETEADYNGISFTADIFRLLATKDNNFDKDKYIEILMKRKEDWKNMLFDFDTQCNYVKELIEKLKKDNITITKELLDIYPILRAIYQQDGNIQNPDVVIPKLKKLANNNNASNELNNFINLLIAVHQNIKEEPPKQK